MKKPLIVLSIVCASALALADSAQYNADWFKGIGVGATATNDMRAVNGSWQFPATEGCATVNESSELVLALDVDDEDNAEEATFRISNAASETNTAQKLSVTGVFNPVSAEDLLSGSKMNEKNAQVGFAVVGVKAGEGAMTYKYYAWVGATDGANAAADWVELSNLGTVANPQASTALTIELNYWNADAMTATFTVGDKAVTNTLTSAAATNKKIASVSCTGSGTLSALDGAYQYAVAEVDGVKYATVDAAVKAAATSTNGTVTVVRNLKNGETVAAANGVTIKAGTDVTLPRDKVTTSDDTKEIVVGVNGVVTVQTKKTILDEVKVGTALKSLTAGAEEADAKVAKFRDFLNKHCGTAYRKAGTTAGVIAEALNADEKSSGRKLWQSYALGVEPEAAVTPQQVAQDTDADNITLALPVNPTGDFTVKCAVGNETPQTLTGQAPTFKVPMTTGRYQVKVSFE